MAARSNCEFGACDTGTCAVTGSGWAEVLPPTEPAVWAGDLSGRRELVVDEQAEALGSVKKHKNVSASIPTPCPSKNEAGEKRANEHTIRREEKNINWLYSRV